MMRSRPWPMIGVVFSSAFVALRLGVVIAAIVGILWVFAAVGQSFPEGVPTKCGSIEISYSVSGATLGPPQDKYDSWRDDFGIEHWSAKREYTGSLSGNELRITGTVSVGGDNVPGVWLMTSVRATDRHGNTLPSKGGVDEYKDWAPANFSFDTYVPIPPDGVEEAGFSISLSTHSGDCYIKITGLLTPGQQPPPPSENRPPTVSLSYSPQNPTPNDTVYFTASASDPDGDALTYRWFLNDVEQTNATAPHVQWANPPEGTYTIRVVVSDGKGGMAEDSLEFTVQAARPRYVIMKGTGEFQGEEPLAFVEKIEVDGKITEGRTPLYKDAYVKTGPGVEIVIRFGSGVVVRVKANTHYEVEGVRVSETSQAVIYTRLIEGLMSFWFKGRALQEKFEVEANRVVVGIKGTEGTIKLISGITTIAVTEGEVEVRDKVTGAVSAVRAGETATFGGGTPPPSGEKTIEQAIDADGDGIINDLEMLQALQYWIKQQIVPGTNKTIDDLTMLSLLQKWIKGTPVR